ncbi:MAG: hypothetical protein GWP14_06915 [Actinobacteria bacterium]|nr:hypothetical protein [Actinomycetota bacterium]
MNQQSMSQPKAPSSMREPEPKRGPRTKKVPGGKLPVVWEPRTLESADGRFGVIKTLKAKVETLKADVGADSFQKALLCERAGFLIALLETQEVNAIEKGQLDAGSYIQSTNCLIGLLRHLGLKRVCRVSSLSSYIEQKDNGK